MAGHFVESRCIQVYTPGLPSIAAYLASISAKNGNLVTVAAIIGVFADNILVSPPSGLIVTMRVDHYG